MVYLSLDDGAMVHERFWIIVGHFNIPFSGVFYYPWVIVGMLLVLIVAAVYIKFFFRLPIRTRWLLLLSGVLFLSGAIGVEMYTSYIMDSSGKGVSALIIGLEETLEIIGVTTLTYTILDYISRLSVESRSVTIEVNGS